MGDKIDQILTLCPVFLLLSCVQLFATTWDCSPPASLFMEFPNKNTGVGCHFPLQGIFPTQGSNPCRLLGRRFFTTEPPGKPNTTLLLLSCHPYLRFSLIPCCRPHSNLRDSALHLDNFGLNIDTNAFCLRFLNTKDL